MKCILLCAGYATRMYPLTENFPKPLLSIKGKPLIDYILEDLNKNTKIDKYIIVSNHKFIDYFKNWKHSDNIVILDDGSVSNDTRLGAVKDIWFAIEKENINDDILVLAGDNLLDFSLKGFIEYAHKKKGNAVMRYFEKELYRLQKTGVAVIDSNEMIINMTEKPIEPKSNWAIPPFYIFKKECLQEIKRGIDSGCKIDAPGEFIEWFCKYNKVYAYEMPGNRIDIGNLEDYNHYK